MYLRCHVGGKVKIHSVYDLVVISSVSIPDAWKFFSKARLIRKTRVHLSNICSSVKRITCLIRQPNVSIQKSIEY